MSKGLAIVFVEEGYETLEFHYPRLRLQEAGYHVEVVSPEKGKTHKSKAGDYPAKVPFISPFPFPSPSCSLSLLSFLFFLLTHTEHGQLGGDQALGGEGCGGAWGPLPGAPAEVPQVRRAAAGLLQRICLIICVCLLSHWFFPSSSSLLFSFPSPITNVLSRLFPWFVPVVPCFFFGLQDGKGAVTGMMYALFHKPCFSFFLSIVCLLHFRCAQPVLWTIGLFYFVYFSLNFCFFLLRTAQLSWRLDGSQRGHPSRPQHHWLL